MKSVIFRQFQSPSWQLLANSTDAERSVSQYTTVSAFQC